MISPTHGVTRLPTIGLVEDPDSTSDLGNIVLPFVTAASTTLLIGDYVYLTNLGTVTKSATVANYTGARVGIVVGGDFLLDGIAKNHIVFDSTLVGKTAGTEGQKVWVAVAGVAYGIANAALATPGARLIAGATSGRVAAGTTAGGIVGIVLTAAADAGDPVKILIQPS